MHRIDPAPTSRKSNGRSVLVATTAPTRSPSSHSRRGRRNALDVAAMAKRTVTEWAFIAADCWLALLVATLTIMLLT